MLGTNLTFEGKTSLWKITLLINLALASQIPSGVMPSKKICASQPKEIPMNTNLRMTAVVAFIPKGI
jgi:hypothetical protein